MATLSDLVENLEGVALERGDPSTPITEISHDSRAVGPGTLFVALRGESFDGHAFIGDAIAAGAAAVLVDDQWDRDVDAPVLRTSSTRRILGPLGSWFFGYPTRSMTVIGITGTNGKTTTSYLLESILEGAGRHVGVIGTIDYRWRGTRVAARNTTPDGLTLQKTLRQMADAGVEVAVLEVSSHGLANDRVAGVEFDVALFTNLSRDHLDFHNSMDEYRRAKWRLFEYFLPASAVKYEDGELPTAVINVERDEGRQLAASLANADGLSLRTFDLGAGEHHRGGAGRYISRQLAVTLDGVAMTVQEPGDGEFSVSAPLPGRFNAENILGAVVVAREIGVEPDKITRGLRELDGIPGRMERVEADGKGPAVFVDYAHTPDALEKALATLEPLVEGQLWVIFGCGGDRDATKRAPMGKVAARLADVVVVTNDNPRREDPEAIIDDVVAGIEEAIEKERCIVEWYRCADRQRAIEEAIWRAHGDDVILIAGKGHETYQERHGERRDFDDRQVARSGFRRLGDRSCSD